MKIRDLSEKGVLFVAQIRGKGGCFLTLEHEYVPFLGPRGGAGISPSNMCENIYTA